MFVCIKEKGKLKRKINWYKKREREREREEEKIEKQRRKGKQKCKFNSDDMSFVVNILFLYFS